MFYEYKGSKDTTDKMITYLESYYESLKNHNLIYDFKIRKNFPKKILMVLKIHFIKTEYMIAGKS